MLSYRIIETDHCRRVESFLQNLLPAAPLAYLRKLVKSGHLAVNGAPATPDTLLRLADTVTLKESGKTRQLLAETRPELDILFEDAWIMVFNKAAGLPMHRAAEVDEWNLVELAGKLLLGRGEVGKLRPVNRLDRGTSGAVVLARSAPAAGMFGRLVKEEGLGKIYLALVTGTPEHEGTIAASLEGKEAETRYRVLFQGKEGALVAVYPLTGRMHQIRQHFRLIGHSILGDRRYGGPPLPGYPGFALHSFLTTLPHPATGQRLAICAPPPEPLLGLLKQLTGPFYGAILKDLADLATAGELH